MALKLSVAPLVEPVSLDEAKLHLRVDSTDEDTLIASLIAAAREDCEDFQNRSYINQTYELWLDSFPLKDYIELPMPPVVSVTSIVYYSTDNTATTILAAAFGTTYFVDSKSEPGKLCLGYGASWPTTVLRPNNGVCITFVCGYGTAEENVPKAFKQAILLTLAALYENREGKAEMPPAALNLLWKERVF